MLGNVIPYSHILETKVNIVEDGVDMSAGNGLLSHANLAMKKELQFMDIIDDEKDKDESFVPR